MIEIIDGFKVNSSTPIDERIIAHGLTARDSIIYKYNGLRVFDTLEIVPYVWMGSWINENSFSVGVSGSSANYIPMFNSGSIIGNSVLYQKYNRIGLNTIDPSDMFEVNNGNIGITGSGYFKGNGQGITNLNASHIGSGNLQLSRIINGDTGYVLCGGTSQPIYVNPSQISVGTSSNSLMTNSVKISASSGLPSNYIPFSSTVGTASELKYNSGFTYDSNKNILNVGTIRFNSISGLTASISKSTHGSFNASRSGLGGTFSVGSIRIDNSVAFSLSATFVTSMRPLSNPPSLIQSYHTNTIESFYMVDNIGSLTQLATSTIFSGGYTYSTSYAYDGYVTLSNNQINFIASVSGFGDYKCTVYYKIVVV